MLNKLYRTQTYLVKSSIKFPIDCIIKNKDAMKEAVAYDHTSAYLGEDSRSNENYKSSNIYMIDIDNDFTNVKEEWITIEDFMKKFSKYKFYIATSKSHNIQKARKEGQRVKPEDTPRPRFHVYFLLDEDLTKDTFPHPLKAQKFFKVVDKQALDKSRFFYGNPSSTIYYCEGEGGDVISDIDDTIIDVEIIEPNNDIEGNLTETGRKQILYYLDYLNKHSFFDDYDTWFALGSALKSSGFEFDDWMNLSYEETDRRDAISMWKSVIEGKHTVGTLIYWIQNNIPSMKGFSPDFEKTIEIDDDEIGNYEIVDVDEFIAEMNEKWVKTINGYGLVIKSLDDGNVYNPQAIEKLYDEYIHMNEDGKYIKAYSEWFDKTIVVEMIKKSSDKNGLTIENGKKIHYIYDEEISNKFVDSVSNDFIKKTFLDKINNKEKVVQSSYSNLRLNLEKGYKTGYVYCFNAMTGVGKTWFLLNEAINISTNLHNNINRDVKVLYVSTEMNFSKLFNRIIGVYYDEHDLNTAMLKFNKDDKNGLEVFKNFGFYFADRGMTTDILLEMIDKGQYDMLFIDYLDDFEPTKSTEVEYKKHRIISEDFTELAVKLDVPILTATQGNRKDSNEDGSVKKNRGFSGVGDGYQKLHKMVGVWNVIKEADEVSTTYRGLVSMKNRDVPNPPDCHFDFRPSGRLIELSSAPQNIKSISTSKKTSVDEWESELAKL